MQTSTVAVVVLVGGGLALGGVLLFRRLSVATSPPANQWSALAAGLSGAGVQGAVKDVGQGVKSVLQIPGQIVGDTVKGIEAAGKGLAYVAKNPQPVARAIVGAPPAIAAGVVQGALGGASALVHGTVNAVTGVAKTAIKDVGHILNPFSW